MSLSVETIRNGARSRFSRLIQSIQRLWWRVLNSTEPIQGHPLPWLAPALAFIAVFMVYPLLDVVRMSFTDKSLVGGEVNYVALESYRAVINQPDFWFMGRITVIFVVASLGLQIVLGLLLALAIDFGRRKLLYGSVLTRVSVLSAWVIPGIVIGILWKVLLIETNYGVVNYVIIELGGSVVPFLSDPGTSLVSVIVANMWRGTAFTMILQFAALQQVPQQLYDAAKIDGASPIARFRYITLPLIKPVLFINIVLGTIYTINTFDMIMALTGGGPGRATEVLALFMYYEAFNRFNLGRASSIAVLMLIINVIMTIVYLRVFFDEEGS